jgi:head-tail adaptor
MRPDPGAVAIGSLRWPVTIAQRNQSPSPLGGITETLVNIMSVRAAVEPVGALTFYSGVQVDTPITHRITIRWLDWLTTTHVILRNTNRPDGSVRAEVFRVHRVLEIDGRKRFCLLECEAESRT